jgi:hypothetical protein
MVAVARFHVALQRSRSLWPQYLEFTGESMKRSMPSILLAFFGIGAVYAQSPPPPQYIEEAHQAGEMYSTGKVICHYSPERLAAFKARYDKKYAPSKSSQAAFAKGMADEEVLVATKGGITDSDEKIAYICKIANVSFSMSEQADAYDKKYPNGQ